MKYLKFTLIFIIPFIITCKKPYSIDLEDIENRILLNSLFSTDSTFKINLTKEANLTENIFNNGFKTINNALIIIYQDNEIIDTANYIDKGNYYGHFKPDSNSKYRVVAKADGFNAVHAENKIPKCVKIDSISKIDMYSKSSLDRYQIKIAFDDPPNEENFYLISAEGTPLNSYAINDPTVGKWNQNMYQVPIFNDKLIDGQKYEITLDLLVQIYGWAEPEWNYITFSLYSISREFYLYAKSYNKQTPKYGDDMMDYFQRGLIEPIPIYSNVKGGLGIFAGYAVSQDSLYFE